MEFTTSILDTMAPSCIAGSFVPVMYSVPLIRAFGPNSTTSAAIATFPVTVASM